MPDDAPHPPRAEADAVLRGAAGERWRALDAAERARIAADLDALRHTALGIADATRALHAEAADTGAAPGAGAAPDPPDAPRDP